MNYLGGCGIAWFMLSGFLGPCSWWFSPGTHPWPWMWWFASESALVVATQEQRDDEVLSSLEASSAAF